MSVILSTSQNDRILRRTLSALAAVERPQCSLEIIVVNNGCTDSTATILEHFRSALPLKVVFEGRKGKSFALNAALKQVQGDLIVFTDDDVVPDGDWLVALERCAYERPHVSVFAGQVRHCWLKPPPDWLRQLAEEGRSFAGTPVEQSDGPVGANFVKGPNFMVRRVVCDRVAFSEEDGINFKGQATSQGGEETLFAAHAVELGFSIEYVASAQVKHIVREEQIGLFPVARRYFRIGRSAGLKNNPPDRSGVPIIFGYPRFLYRQLSISAFRFCINWLCRRKYKAASEVVWLATTMGREYEWKQARHKVWE